MHPFTSLHIESGSMSMRNMMVGDVFLGDDRKARIIVCRKVKLKLQGGRARTLLGVLHIPTLARNLI